MEGSSTSRTTTDDLYSLLKVSKDATKEEIHRAYKSLSTAFHPDKLKPTTSAEKREQIQQVFLEFKHANDILTDDVLRLVYDYYGEEGVTLLKRIQQQKREHQDRKKSGVDGGDDDDDDDDDEADDTDANVYEKMERLLANDKRSDARDVLRRFMDQYDYHQNLVEGNQVQLSCNVDFPPVVDLKGLYYHGRDYLQAMQKRGLTSRGIVQADRKTFQQMLKDEQRLVDYQINQIRDSQKARVGFSLSSVQPRNQPAAAHSGATSSTSASGHVPPKWMMLVGSSTSLIYPDVAKVVTLIGQEEPELKHPSSAQINMIYQPVANSQVSINANLSNDQSHQFVLGTSRVFTNRSEYRYHMTYLTKSPLASNLIVNMKSSRHLKNLGVGSAGVSIGGDGLFLQWNAKWEAIRKKNHIEKLSAKVTAGRLQGNSVEVAYKIKRQNRTWYDRHIKLPKEFEITGSSGMGGLPKFAAMLTQDFTSLASHPTLGFGLEHDSALGLWTWVWEFNYLNSSFRVPIPVIHLGMIADPHRYYSQRFYYGLYCILLQTLLADLFQDDDHQTKKHQSDFFDSMSKKSNVGTTAFPTNQPSIVPESILNMISKVAEKKRKLEKACEDKGLIILKATYWVERRQDENDVNDDIMFSSAISNSRIISSDVTDQVQFWVSNGKLSLPALPKSSLLGFPRLMVGDKGQWRQEQHQQQKTTTKITSVLDYLMVCQQWLFQKRQSIQKNGFIASFLSSSATSTTTATMTTNEPQLTVRYTNQGSIYEITVSENETLELPATADNDTDHTHNKAQMMGNANYVQ